MASNMTQEQLNTIKAVWYSNPGYNDPAGFIALMVQYGVTINDLMTATGLNVQTMMDYFYARGFAPNGWGGLPDKRSWYLAHIRWDFQVISQHPLSAAETALANQSDAVGLNTSLDGNYLVTNITGPEDNKYMYRDGDGGQTASVNTWGGGSTSTPYIPTPPAPVQPKVVPVLAPAPPVNSVNVPRTNVTSTTPGVIRLTDNYPLPVPPKQPTASSAKSGFTVLALVATLLEFMK